MPFYQASLIVDCTGRWMCMYVSQPGNPLKTRIDHFTCAHVSRQLDRRPQFGPRVLRMMVAPEDSMHCNEYVNVRQLAERYNAHAAIERARIEAVLKRPLNLLRYAFPDHITKDGVGVWRR